MGTKPKDQDDALQLLMESLAADVLMDKVSDAEVDQDLRDAGGDPEAIGQRGAALAQALIEKQRLEWQDAARAKKAAFDAALASRPRRPRGTRGEMLAAIDQFRRDPAMSDTVSVTFRKRKPEESSDDELAELLDELDVLREMKRDGGKTPDK